jgi:ABC-2 type transport system permease protein
METTTPTAPRPKRFKRFLNWWTENPVIIKELRGRMRGRQAFLLLTGYLALISLFIAFIYIYISTEVGGSQWDPDFRQGVGKAIFGTVVMLELLLISFIGPGLTSGAISSEREHQTYDLLRTTLLSARALVFGKLGSASSYIFLLIFTALPIQALAFLIGGVGMAELLVSSLMLVITALFFCALGLFYSSFMKRTLTSTVTSYATILVTTLGLGLALMFIIALENGSLNTFQEDMLGIMLWFTISSNPLIAAAVSEAILIDDQTLFLTTSGPFNNTFPLLSPWIIFSLLYLGLTVIMIALSIHFVKRPDH